MIDTAGIRRRGKVQFGVESHSVLRTLRALDRCNVALLVVDAAEGLTAQDVHIAGYVNEAHKGLVVLINKWDLVDADAGEVKRIGAGPPAMDAPRTIRSHICRDRLSSRSRVAGGVAGLCGKGETHIYRCAQPRAP